MQKLFISIILSATLTANIISFSFNTYNCIVPNNKPVKTYKIVQAPLWTALIIGIKYWWSGGGSGSGKSPMPKPGE